VVTVGVVLLGAVFLLIWRSYGFLAGALALVVFMTVAPYVDSHYGSAGSTVVLIVMGLLGAKALYDGPRTRLSSTPTGRYGYGPGDTMPPSHKTPGGPGDPGGAPPL
jgi:hypothetical protein